MTRRRWIADEVSGNRAALVGQHAEHLVRVLRAKVGQQFDLIALGIIRRARITSVQKNRVEFELGANIPTSLPANISILLSIFKFDRMEWAIEKCTELGVARMVPVIAQRTEVHLASAAAKRMERWQRIVRQASEQSRRASVPELTAPMKLKDAMSLSTAQGVVLSELEQEVRLRDCVPHDVSAGLALAFGPEGGWTQPELALFREAGWKSASLGDTILRAETAVIAAVAVVLCDI
jgi:16S rRNA (uracil1498-N3)-methyltransferase